MITNKMVNNKRNILFIILLLFSTFFCFSQSAEVGLGYDTYHEGNHFGFFGNINSTITPKIKLNVDLEYKGDNNYNFFLVTDNKIFSFLSLESGFNVSFSDNEFLPGFMVITKLNTKKLFTFKLGTVIFLNPENILKPNNFLFTTGCTLTSNNAVLNIDLDYGLKNQFTKHNFSSKTSVRAFKEGTPIALGLNLSSNFTLDLNAKMKFNVAIEGGASIELIKNKSFTILQFKTIFYELYKEKDFPFMLLLSKKVTF